MGHLISAGFRDDGRSRLMQLACTRSIVYTIHALRALVRPLKHRVQRVHLVLLRSERLDDGRERSLSRRDDQPSIWPAVIALAIQLNRLRQVCGRSLIDSRDLLILVTSTGESCGVVGDGSSAGFTGSQAAVCCPEDTELTLKVDLVPCSAYGCRFQDVLYEREEIVLELMVVGRVVRSGGRG